MGQRILRLEETRTKAQGVCDALNRMLFDLVIRSTKDQGVLDYFFLAVVGYGYPVRSLLSRPQCTKPVPISHVAARPLRIDERKALNREGIAVSVRMPVWVDPQAYGHTERLFDISSELPAFIVQSLTNDGEMISPGARGLVYNSDLASLVSFFDIGTRALRQR
jgi:hypothetical protein